jgi:Helix-turn-helix domain
MDKRYRRMGLTRTLPLIGQADSSASNSRSKRPIWLGADQHKWDHIRIHLQLLVDPRIDGITFSIYCGLALHADIKSGECFPGEQTLADYAGCSLSTVKRRLAVLIECGYIERFIREGFSNAYRVLPCPVLPEQIRANLSDAALKRIYQPTDPGHSEPGQGDTPVTVTGDPGHSELTSQVRVNRDPGHSELLTRTSEREPGNQNHLTTAKPPGKPKRLPFEEFWDLYPTRNRTKAGRHEAETFWRLKMTNEQRQAATIAARHYAMLCRDDGTSQLACDAERFLKHKRYEDYQQPPVVIETLTSSQQKARRMAEWLASLAEGEPKIEIES